MYARLIRFAFRRSLRIRTKNVDKAAAFIIDLSHNISVDHLHSICTSMIETEATTLVVHMALVLFRMKKLKRKPK